MGLVAGVAACTEAVPKQESFQEKTTVLAGSLPAGALELLPCWGSVVETQAGLGFEH